MELRAVEDGRHPPTQVSRLATILALKEAYFRASRKSTDYQDVEFNIFSGTTIPSVRVNGFPLGGWEFHAWRENLIMSNPNEFEELYQCAVAFYRPTERAAIFHLHKAPEEWGSLQVTTIDETLSCIPHLSRPMPVRPWRAYSN